MGRKGEWVGHRQLLRRLGLLGSAPVGLVLVGFCLGLECNSGWWHQESLTNLFFSSKEVDVTGRATFFSTFSKASFPSANVGKNDSIWLVGRQLFCFLKIGSYFHLSKRSPRSPVLISPSSWSQGPTFAKTASLAPWRLDPLEASLCLCQGLPSAVTASLWCALVAFWSLRVCGGGRGLHKHFWSFSLCPSFLPLSSGFLDYWAVWPTERGNPESKAKFQAGIWLLKPGQRRPGLGCPWDMRHGRPWDMSSLCKLTRVICHRQVFWAFSPWPFALKNKQTNNQTNLDFTK